MADNAMPAPLGYYNALAPTRDEQNTTLAQLLMRQPPVMPEEYDTPEALGSLTPHLRALGAGFVDPAGVPSALVNALAGTPGTDWYSRRMQELRDESPMAAGMGSALIPGVGAGRAIGGTLKEILDPKFLLALMLLGGQGGQARSQVVGPLTRPRPQGAYPPGGAY